MPGCSTTVAVTFFNGRPAPFASVDVWEVHCFLWWCNDTAYLGLTAGVDGKATFNLTRGQAYHIRVRARDPTGRTLQRDVYRTLTSCPYNIGIYLPQ